MTRFPLLHLRRRCSILVVSICAFSACMAVAEEIKIGGTGNALGTMRLLGDKFTKANPEIKVTVLNSLGSSGAVKALPKGAIDIGVTSRVLSDDERKEGLVAREYARTPTVTAVSAKSKVTAITRDQLADIYNGKLSKWPDGTLIRPVLRQPGDDNTKQIKGLSVAIEKALTEAEQRPGLPFAVTDQEAADKMESVPGAIGVTTLALIKSESRPLRALTLDNVDPTPTNAASGAYSMVKHFYFITPTAPSATAQKFMTFVNSPAGREVLAQTGHWVP